MPTKLYGGSQVIVHGVRGLFWSARAISSRLTAARPQWPPAAAVAVGGVSSAGPPAAAARAAGAGDEGRGGPAQTAAADASSCSRAPVWPPSDRESAPTGIAARSSAGTDPRDAPSWPAPAASSETLPDHIDD